MCRATYLRGRCNVLLCQRGGRRCPCSGYVGRTRGEPRRRGGRGICKMQHFGSLARFLRRGVDPFRRSWGGGGRVG